MLAHGGTESTPLLFGSCGCRGKRKKPVKNGCLLILDINSNIRGLSQPQEAAIRTALAKVGARTHATILLVTRNYYTNFFANILLPSDLLAAAQSKAIKRVVHHAAPVVKFLKKYLREHKVSISGAVLHPPPKSSSHRLQVIYSRCILTRHYASCR